MRFCAAGLALPAWMIAMHSPTDVSGCVAVISVSVICELVALVLGIINWKSGAGKTAVILAAVVLFLAVPGSLWCKARLSVPSSADAPEITRVVVSKDQAIITGRSPDAGMFIMIGALTNNDVWVAPHNGSPFSVSLTPQWFWRGGYDWIVKASYGNITYRLDSKAGPLTGRIVFRPGTPAPEADGSYVIGEFQQASGPPLPIAVRLERTSKQPASPAPNLSFGPMIERTLPFHTNGITDAFGLESNQVVTLPASGRLPNSLLFLDDDDGNAIYISGQLGVSVMAVKNQSWETISTARSMEMLATKTNLMSFAMVKKSDWPAIFLFTTWRGTAGVLKITNSTVREDGLDLNYKFITENSTNAVLFPPQDYSQPVPPTGFKPIPPEAVRLFQQSRELMAAKLFSLPHSETKASLLESAKTQMELVDIGRKLAPLLIGTSFEAASLRQMNAFLKWQQLDPNQDQKKWKQANTEMSAAQFNEERLMAEAGAADIIQPGADKLKFGSWKEAVVSHPSLGTNCCVNFDTGVVLTPPAEILTEMTVTNRPGNDFFEAMPESFFWGEIPGRLQGYKRIGTMD